MERIVQQWWRQQPWNVRKTCEELGDMGGDWVALAGLEKWLDLMILEAFPIWTIPGFQSSRKGRCPHISLQELGILGWVVLVCKLPQSFIEHSQCFKYLRDGSAEIWGIPLGWGRSSKKENRALADIQALGRFPPALSQGICRRKYILLGMINCVSSLGANWLWISLGNANNNLWGRIKLRQRPGYQLK